MALSSTGPKQAAAWCWHGEQPQGFLLDKGFPESCHLSITLQAKDLCSPLACRSTSPPPSGSPGRCRNLPRGMQSCCRSAAGRAWPSRSCRTAHVRPALSPSWAPAHSSCRAPPLAGTAAQCRDMTALKEQTAQSGPPLLLELQRSGDTLYAEDTSPGRGCSKQHSAQVGQSVRNGCERLF